jgi:hypothetical protein
VRDPSIKVYPGNRNSSGLYSQRTGSVLSPTCVGSRSFHTTMMRVRYSKPSVSLVSRRQTLQQFWCSCLACCSLLIRSIERSVACLLQITTGIWLPIWIPEVYFHQSEATVVFTDISSTSSSPNTRRQTSGSEIRTLMDQRMTNPDKSPLFTARGRKPKDKF